MFWKRKKEPIEGCADALYMALKKAVSPDGHNIRVEDLICAAASIVAESAIAAAGHFDPRRHDFAPGSRVFSDTINALICDDKPLQEAPSRSIVGDLRERLTACGFTQSDFPALEDIFQHFAANIGKAEEWGRVPLSVPRQHHPVAPPLRAAYEARAMVDRALLPLGQHPGNRLRSATGVLARALCETRDVLPRKVATTLALETLNGMAKTAPMTDAAMARLRAAAKKST